LIIDPADDEINVLLPMVLGVFVLFCLSIFSLVLSYMLKYQVILFDVSSLKITAMKWFGFIGGSISVLIILGFLALS
jgi:hypothetical protein